MRYQISISRTPPTKRRSHAELEARHRLTQHKLWKTSQRSLTMEPDKRELNRNRNETRNEGCGGWKVRRGRRDFDENSLIYPQRLFGLRCYLIQLNSLIDDPRAVIPTPDRLQSRPSSAHISPPPPQHHHKPLHSSAIPVSSLCKQRSPRRRGPGTLCGSTVCIEIPRDTLIQSQSLFK